MAAKVKGTLGSKRAGRGEGGVAVVVVCVCMCVHVHMCMWGRPRGVRRGGEWSW